MMEPPDVNYAVNICVQHYSTRTASRAHPLTYTVYTNAYALPGYRIPMIHIPKLQLLILISQGDSEKLIFLLVFRMEVVQESCCFSPEHLVNILSSID